MSKYKNFSKEELLRIVERQEQELKQKKYGLVWDAEREPEQVVLDCENNLPVLKRVKGKEIRTDLKQEDNILIEGDNYHALTVLNYTHKGKIDVIYIDPPYNTGAKDWKYNNSFVGADDGFRHSKWLNFMEKRLNIAKELLKPEGIICVTIDDYEAPRLWMLMEKIFGEHNHLGTVAIRINPGGRKTKRKVAAQHEYALFFSKEQYVQVSKIPINPNDKTHSYKKDENGEWYEERNLRKEGADSLAKPESDRYYTIYYDPKSKKISTKNKYSVKILPIDTNGEKRIWRRSIDDIDKLFNEGSIFTKNTKFGLQIYFRFKGGLEGETPKSFWDSVKYSASEHGTQVLDKIIGEREKFNFPKSIFATKDCIKVASSNPKAIILDYFAGSGTTGQAVLDLNKEDGGNRKFILCTNNENNICTDVCYPRLEKVINGYKKNGNGEKVEGLKGNLQYFKTAMVKKNRDGLQTRIDLTGKCVEMLCVKENIYDLVKKADDYHIYASNSKDAHLGVYFNFVENTYADFYKELEKIKTKKIVYMFSLDDEIDKKLFKGISDISIEAIPEEILEIYARLVRQNIPLRADLIQYDLVRAKDDIFEKKDKDAGAQKLRVVLEKIIQKIAQKYSIGIYNENNKAEKISVINDRLKQGKIFSKVEWEENKTYLAIGNHAAHGEYDEYDLAQAENFYKHLHNLIQKNNINL